MRLMLLTDFTDFHPKKITKIVPGDLKRPIRLNARVVAKYSDFGLVEGHISETVQDARHVNINH